MSDRRGSGLMKKDDDFDCLRKQTKYINFWLWDPIKLTNNALSSHGELACRACNAKMYYLRSIKDHIKANKHKKYLEKRKVAVENKWILCKYFAGKS